MQEKIGRGDTCREGPRQRRALASLSAISMRGRGKIGRADRGLVALSAQKLLDARAVSAGRRAEDARKAPALVAARGGGERIVAVLIAAFGEQPHGRVDQRDL